jgi:HEAT repeat protein
MTATVSTVAAITPDELFSRFRQGGYRASLAAFRRFAAVKDKRPFFDPAVAFLAAEDDDAKRAWATSVLAQIGGKRAIDALQAIFEATIDPTLLRRHRYTRFFGLAALERLAQGRPEQTGVDALLVDLWKPNWGEADEDVLVQAEAAALLALRRREDARAQLDEMLDAAHGTESKDFWITWASLRALREFAVPGVAPRVIEIARSGRYLDHQWYAVRALGAFRDNPAVANELGTIARAHNDSYLRLAAVMALGELRRVDSAGALIETLTDDNAEVRVQAASAICDLLPLKDAVAAIVPRVLVPNLAEDEVRHLTDALRSIDKDRLVCAELLNRELSSDDRSRAELAEKILLELGGWAALHRLSQRRTTLDSLDKIVRQSEEVVNRTFADMIKHARANFRFAMCVNVLIVCIGIALIVVAVYEVARKPDKLEGWLVPGGSGVFVILLNLFFNNPRKNARQDLGSLIDVVVIFLGFTRQLNEIDATFKYAYIENPQFGIAEMRDTVREIDSAVGRTINLAAERLGAIRTGKTSAKLRDDPETASVVEGVGALAS